MAVGNCSLPDKIIGIETEVNSMLRPLSEKDYESAIDIVNEDWKITYSNYVNPLLLDENGCKERAERLRNDKMRNVKS